MIFWSKMIYKVQRFFTIAVTDPMALPGKIIKVDFFRFALVGAIGFVVNFFILAALHDGLGWSIVASQVIGAETAILSNFLFHDNWTFRNREQASVWGRLIRFHISMAVGMIINSSIVIFLAGVLGVHYAIGLICGSAVAMGWNFMWTRYYIWRKNATVA